VGAFHITNHAREKLKERHGELYVGNKKAKNAGRHRLSRLIIDSIKNRKKDIYEQDDGALRVETGDFEAIIVPNYRNHVVTII